MTLQQALKYGTAILKKTSESSILDAEILLSFVLKKDRVFLFTYRGKKLKAWQWQKYKKLIFRRKKHEPIAYITHHKEFYGLDFYVDKRVLIPRPETEKLVEKTINFVKTKPKNYCHSDPPPCITIPQNNLFKIKKKREISYGYLSKKWWGRRIPRLAERSFGRSNKLELPQDDFVVCDIGTGSGCIAIALAKNLPKAKIWASDISKKALFVARANAKKHGVSKRIKFIRSDLLSEIPKDVRFDIIAANLPYLSKKEYQRVSLDIKKHEPKSALIAGSQGNVIYKKLIRQAPGYLKKNGKIFLENF